MTELRHYINIGSDSARWLNFEPRPGDIIIATPPKTGTTLTQRLCSLAIFETDELPGRMDDLSPWFDAHHRTEQEINALLEAQQHRRFIKTHTPLDGLPYWPEVTYLATARDPRDIFASWEGQYSNLDRERTRAAFFETIGEAKTAELMSPPPETLEGRVDQWLETDDIMLFSLLRHLHQISVSWERRELPNVSLLHYRDIRGDKQTSLRLVADAIGAGLTAEQVAELAPHADIDAMRADAANLAPNTKGIFSEPDQFFRTGGSGGWRDLLSDDHAARYWERCNELLADDVSEWLHGATR